jgi:hypothetical protein
MHARDPSACLQGLEGEVVALKATAEARRVAEAARDAAAAERDAAAEDVGRLQEALGALQNGPNAELMQAWDEERRELLADLEAAENRVLGMQTQVCAARSSARMHLMHVACDRNACAGGGQRRGAAQAAQGAGAAAEGEGGSAE